MEIGPALTTHNWPVEMWEAVIRDKDHNPVAIAVGPTETECLAKAGVIAMAFDLLEAV